MDKDLAARLGVASSVSVAPYLKYIHDQIMNTDGPNTLKVSVELKFSVDDDGLVDVDVSARVPLKSPGRVIRLRSAKDQLALFVSPPKAKLPTKKEERFPASVEDLSSEDQDAIAKAIGES